MKDTLEPTSKEPPVNYLIETVALKRKKLGLFNTVGD